VGFWLRTSRQLRFFHADGLKTVKRHLRGSDTHTQERMAHQRVCRRQMRGKLEAGDRPEVIGRPLATGPGSGGLIACAVARPAS
jgi:hypothetical protein